MGLIKENRCHHGICEIKRYTTAARGCSFSLTVDLSLSDDDIEAQVEEKINDISPTTTSDLDSKMKCLGLN